MKDFFINFFTLSEPLSITFVLVYLILCFWLNRLAYTISFAKRMTLALFLGVILGVLAQYLANYPANSKEILWLEQTRIWYSFVVSIFISLLKLMIVPIVFFGISSSLLKLEGGVKISSILSRSIFWLLITTAIASAIGLSLGVIFNLGSDVVVQTSKTIKEARTLSSILLGLMPNNIIDSFANNNILGVILVAFLFTLGARKIGTKEENKEIFSTYKNLVIFINKIIMNVITNIIQLMPYAVVAMIANVLIANGVAAMKEAGLFIILTYASGILMIIVFSIILAFHGLSPMVYYKKAFEVLLLAFTSRSSAGVLPITIRTLHTKLGVSENNANFVAGLGATIGMSGCAGYYVGLVAAFIMHSAGLSIDLSSAVLIIIITLVGSLSIAGIPGISIVAASIMITGLGLGDKFYLLGVIFAIDPIIDMVRTMSNVNGAMIAAIATDSELKTLNKDEYKDLNNERD
ncbi:cation:dicarboxylase symporter family transporter [Campylobacter sp. RM12651]|uniref:cation:dicarboxylate symporter family transporter n=1 Tax=Campylobacter sp. RM12651 TaxID=1660079 RepID=UPI001EFB7EA4|nr:cation:dicarboxylase symporter family transporter [Campylobacter sp. RM12651]ULO04379.1 L-cystine uptake protein TcyP [Campylobacter sp. RM12651]